MRSSGILLPVFSLPGKYGIGCFSKNAYHFVDFLKDCGQSFWQILPLGPTGYGDSPYQSFSTFAGNPYFIDPEVLIRQGLLTRKECEETFFGDSDTAIDYAALYHQRLPLLALAYERSGISQDPEFLRFCQDNSYWLEDYALFMALKDSFDGAGFRSWPEDIRRRLPSAMASYREKLQDRIGFYEYLQFEFSRQWQKLKAYANENGIQIIGDIPIYVAADSADVWAHPELFQLDEDANPVSVAGCPPDGFSATGQLWGNPLYDWEKNKETGYDWWIRRISKCHEMYDVIRIDHFRGFDEYFSIPAGDSDARRGVWMKGPGMDLFLAIRAALGDISIIAEDLGYITDSVRQLVRDSGFPNMKVLEFAFDSRDSSGPAEYLPFNYNKNCVVYTGTHDNEPLMEWLSHILPEEVTMIQDYLGQHLTNKQKLSAALIRMAVSSAADLCVIPLQDYLFLGEEARINKPSVVGINWKWRLTGRQLSSGLKKRISGFTELYGRERKL